MSSISRFIPAFVVFCLASAVSVQEAPRPEGPPVVYFLEFDARTYLPANEGRIKEFYNMTSLFEGRHLELSKILLDRTEGGSFDDSLVRLSVGYVGQKPILVDRHGNVRVGARTYSLTEKGFRDLKTFIWSATPKVQLP